MGMVVRAFDQELGRDVAIKVLLFDGAREELAQERFMREAKALAVLNHPNVVRIFSAGLSGQGNPYNVMEFLEGESLSRRLERGSLSADEFYEVFTQVSSGLIHAHEHNIVHRDLKPSNIMICTGTDGKSVYKLIDFGIARMDMSPERAARTLTRTNAVLGSPIYISPEQCRGERGDFRSDIYSLGVIMYECIDGKSPFHGDTAFETMYKHMSETCNRLDTHTKGIPSKELASLIERCLEKNPSARPQNLGEIETELKRIFSSDKNKIDLFAQKKHPKKELPAFSWLYALAAVLVIFAAAYLFRGNFLPSSDRVVQSEQSKLSHTIERMKSRINGSAAALSSKDKSLRESHLLELFDLGRTQLRSKNTVELTDAVRTYSEALQFCDSCQTEFAGQRAACLAYRGKARFLLKDPGAGEKDFDKAIKVAGEGALPDIYLERCALRLSNHDVLGANADFKAAIDDFHKKGGIENLGFFLPKLDRNGELRCMLFNNISYALCKLKPRSQKEAVEILSFSNQLVPLLTEIHHKSEARASAQYGLTLLDQIEGHADLKETAKQLRKGISDS